jgi:hypothetical protein
LGWYTFFATRPAAVKDIYPGSGLVLADTSAPIVGGIIGGYTPDTFSAPEGQTFTLSGMSLTPAFREDLEVVIEGFAEDGSSIAEFEITLDMQTNSE